MITELNHLTINVVNLGKSNLFYADVLGLLPAGTIDMGDHTLTYYALPGGCRLELICYANPSGTMHPPSDTSGISAFVPHRWKNCIRGACSMA